jgi:hypothetical protein
MKHVVVIDTSSSTEEEEEKDAPLPPPPPVICNLPLEKGKAFKGLEWDGNIWVPSTTLAEAIFDYSKGTLTMERAKYRVRGQMLERAAYPATRRLVGRKGPHADAFKLLYQAGVIGHGDKINVILYRDPERIYTKYKEGVEKKEKGKALYTKV